ncbi:MAG: DUF4830 domain-containing protein [Ruminococcus sp.]|nr:DUF4830 domain-containing protein [Ruminococcus sp.]MCM1380814.1 DUF4830 domain-containing protein [Muribaculaceae bacterium]MCM1479607.1 DUF4830 domain-containing protein [Muribaculaceae bacterium]
MSKGSSKKGIKIILFLVLVIAAIAALAFWCKAKEETETDSILAMSSNAQRVEFLNKQGWIVKPDPISREDITVPSDFDGVYAEYAELQKSQGFDLEKYKGKPATLFTYQVLNYPDRPENVVATLVVSSDRLIAADVSLTGEDGFTEPLIAPSTQTYLVIE